MSPGEGDGIADNKIMLGLFLFEGESRRASPAKVAGYEPSAE